jgi:tetratricopeptide (TPR) repeat protein
MYLSRLTPLSGGATPRRYLAYSILSGSLLIFGSVASAQVGGAPIPGAVPMADPNGITLPAPGTTLGTPLAPGVQAPALPKAPPIGILLLALDELPAPDAPLPSLPQPLTAPTAPAAILPEGLPAITAAAYAPLALRPFWMAQAQTKEKVKTPKVPKPRQQTDDEIFRLEPDRGLMPSVRTPPTAPDAPVVPDEIFPPVGAQPALPSQGPAGRAQITSITLRRALMSLGWADVMPTAPDAGAISRAIGERRFTNRTIDELKSALAKIAAPGAKLSPQDTANATAAAARIGQALGYRAVVAFYVAPPQTKDADQTAAFSFILADSSRETGEPILFDEQAPTASALNDVGASTAAALIDKSLRGWPEVSGTEKVALAQKHLANARVALAAGNNVLAQEELSQTISLDSSKSEPYSLLGDLLSGTDPIGAAIAYRRVVELDRTDGATWAKIAIAYTTGAVPDWPNALKASREALATSYDSVPLRVAIATAQFGRADLFRRADRLDRAEDAEFEARKNLDRALELAPDDPGAVRLMARKLVEARRFEDATQTLDRVAPRYPNDVEIQNSYAQALSGQRGREADAFAAYARVWKLSNTKKADFDLPTYNALAKGFDTRVYDIGRSAVNLTTGVANGALPREDALLQLTKLKEDMSAAEYAIGIIRAPGTINSPAAAARAFAADLMNQSLESQQIYLETGQELQRLRGSQLNAQAVAQLNSARTSR